MTRHRPIPHPASTPSFALISVLALVSLAALTATAFLASARLEKRATMSLANSTRLEMAIHAASVAATELLDDGHHDDLNFVTTYWRGSGSNDWTNELGYLLNGYSTNRGTNTTFCYFACFSTATFTNLSNSLTPTIDVSNYVANQGAFLKTVSSNMKTWTTFPPGQSTNIPLLGDTPTNRYTSPPVGWVYIRQDVRTKPGLTNTTNIPVARFAFYVQDLGGLLDAQRNGALTSRDSGTNPEEVSLTNATGSSLISSSKAKNLATNSTRLKLLSPGTLINGSAGNLDTNDLRYVTTGLPQWNAAWNIIPSGLGYKDSVQTNKYNLNAANFLDSNNLGSLVAIIRSNLPQFSARGGAMAGDAYLSNIAANLIDYVDTNQIPCIDISNSPPAWRGVEAIAWPNEVFTRFNLTARTTNSPNYKFQLSVKQYIELWNLNSISVTADATNYAISNNLNIPLQCGNWNGNLKSVDPTTPPISETPTNSGANPITLPPNSYAVIAANTRTFNILVPIALAGTNTKLSLKPSGTINVYKISYTYPSNITAVIDSPVGRWCGASTNLAVGNFHFISTAVNFGTSANGNQYNLAGGDPRGSFFNTQPAMEFPWNETTPGGRNSHLSSSGGARIVDPKVNWPDGGHSSGLDLVPSPTDANSSNNIPEGLRKLGNPGYALQKLNNTGRITNLMELGNIFDPIQWGDPNNPFNPLDTASWMTLSNTATAFSGACGRNTLRIGRAEHPRFAFTNQGSGNTPAPNMMMSAAALLDLFCLTNTDGRYDEGGRINLNTAPAPVLRALAGGVILSNDPTLVNSLNGVGNHAVPTGMAEAFAQGVMRFRSKYPFYSPSQISFIGTDSAWPNTNTWPSNSVFGNTNSISLAASLSGNVSGGSTKINVNEWNDTAAEEWFSKIYQLATVQSRNYRCYIIAQLVDEKGDPTGPTARKYYNIFARNNCLNPGESTGASTYTVYESPY